MTTKRNPGACRFYEFRVRDGSGYDPYAPINAGFDFGCVGPQPFPVDCSIVKFPLLRKFDQANRYLHRFDLLSRIAPVEALELTFTTNFGYADYNDTDFGLTESLEWSFGSDAFYQIHPRVSLLAESRRLRIARASPQLPHHRRGRSRPTRSRFPGKRDPHAAHRRSRAERARALAVPGRPDLLPHPGYAAQRHGPASSRPRHHG